MISEPSLSPSEWLVITELSALVDIYPAFALVVKVQCHLGPGFVPCP